MAVVSALSMMLDTSVCAAPRNLAMPHHTPVVCLMIMAAVKKYIFLESQVPYDKTVTIRHPRQAFDSAKFGGQS
jgi:hypothetical protein